MKKAPASPIEWNMCSIHAVRQFSDEDRVEGIFVSSHIHRKHEAVNHNVKELVRGQAHTIGIESFWATLERRFNGRHHHFSTKHRRRYVNEFAGGHNDRPLESETQIANITFGMDGTRLRYRSLNGPRHTRQSQLI